MALKTTLKDFYTDFDSLKEDLENDKEIEQNYYGDFLMIEEEDEKERYRVWLSNEDNIGQGQAEWQIEYSGKLNRWVWEVIADSDSGIIEDYAR